GAGPAAPERRDAAGREQAAGIARSAEGTGVTGPARSMDRAPDAAAELVVQGPDLSPEAIAAFCHRFAAAALQRQAASVRLAAIGPAGVSRSLVADLAT